MNPTASVDLTGAQYVNSGRAILELTIKHFRENQYFSKLERLIQAFGLNVEKRAGFKWTLMPEAIEEKL